jgi:hypothetical protein
MRGLDAWLEAPYVDAARREDDYVKWCEANELDPSEDHWDDFEDAMYDAAEDAMIDAAERAREDY